LKKLGRKFSWKSAENTTKQRWTARSVDGDELNKNEALVRRRRE
jgi:hypothetical protein